MVGLLLVLDEREREMRPSCQKTRVLRSWKKKETLFEMSENAREKLEKKRRATRRSCVIDVRQFFNSKTRLMGDKDETG